MIEKLNFDTFCLFLFGISLLYLFLKFPTLTLLLWKMLQVSHVLHFVDSMWMVLGSLE